MATMAGIVVNFYIQLIDFFLGQRSLYSIKDSLVWLQIRSESGYPLRHVIGKINNSFTRNILLDFIYSMKSSVSGDILNYEKVMGIECRGVKTIPGKNGRQMGRMKSVNSTCLSATAIPTSKYGWPWKVEKVE